ncbi:MAG: 3-deoxy-7-phosphoheptulonate synthase [Deltaproteobacteria bacterium]|nr:3-deoxy-7-phosphoheptulonate synthase [Deltaproteobacteria bacterium]
MEKTREITLRKNGVSIGGEKKLLCAGPCAVESLNQIKEIAAFLKVTETPLLRGGSFKLRTSPQSFQGLGEEALKFLKEVGEEFNLLTVTEVATPEQIKLAYEYVDVLQIGARSSQNPYLLKEAGRQRKPVLLKRGMMMTIEELLWASEYITREGNPNVILCERGIRTFEPSTRNTLDLSAVVILKEKTNLPIMVDPSHAVGHAHYVSKLAKAALVSGADGLMIEIHPTPHTALSDGRQALDFKTYEKLVHELRAETISFTI